MTDAVGFIASTWALVLAVSPLLQFRQMQRTRSSRDVSIANMAIVLIALILWAVYGWLLGNMYLAVPNTVATFVMAAVLTSAVRLRRTEPEAEAPCAST